MPFSLPQQMIRTAGIFQVVVAIPTTLIMGEWIIEQFFTPYFGIYDFITAISTSLMSATIIFIVFVQRSISQTQNSTQNSTQTTSQNSTNPSTSTNNRERVNTTFHFELAKSLLATALWLWLMLDAAFGPERWYGGNGRWRGRKMGKAGISVVLLLIVFYPTLVYAVFEKRREVGMGAGAGAGVERNRERDAGEGNAEREPLLRG